MLAKAGRRVQKSLLHLSPTASSLLVASVLVLSCPAPAAAASAWGASRKISPAQHAELHSLASTLMAGNPALASRLARGAPPVNPAAFTSVSAMATALTASSSPAGGLSTLRLRGGHAAPSRTSPRAPRAPTLPSLAARSPARCVAPVRQDPVSARVHQGLKAMARGAVFGAPSALKLHSSSLARLRGGMSQRSMSAGGSGGVTMAAVEEASKLAVPECVAGGDEMAPQYDPKLVEQELYKWWEASGFFQPPAYKEGEKKSYVLPMPPPNVTGGLHMGHALFVALQDILARFHRMKGEPTLWLPGTDHAGIATQLLVERSLNAQGISRFELGREKFLEKVWEWKNEKGDYITSQMRYLGASADWTRSRFTMDDEMSASVSEAFYQLHEKGLVYRGEYMVNWSPNLRTAVSDLEVEYTEEEGKLYYFKYMIAGGGSEDFLSVATTRPETIPGDTAVFVHPEDPRFKHLVGKMVKVPFQDREIPIMADEYVDMEFGTGCLKVTPGHDPNDNILGKKHNLQTINIMNLDGTLNANAGVDYDGVDRFEARTKLWAALEAAGLAIEAKPHMQRVPRSQRGGEIIEPLMSTQWFVKTRGMADKATEAVKSGEMKIIPQRFEKTWFQWLDNIHDWCVSRQLWWGHRIPVWHVIGSGAFPTTTEYVVARNEAHAYEQARTKYGAEVELQQDNDVLDTWFSSGLWPFSTVGWPKDGVDANQASDMARFFSNRGESCLETGYDILFFWVARMVMMSCELTGRVPFDTVYMHGLVRDAKGKKMSKTTGNVIDPLDVISEYGTDALRYTLVTGCTPGQDLPLDPKRVEANRNFANKLWNSARFILGNLKDLSPSEKAALAVTGPMTSEELSQLALPERYIVSRCHELVGTVTAQLDAYTLGQAGEQIQNFLWDEFADWYLEASKVRIFASQKTDDPEVARAAQEARRVLVYVLDTCLRLLHPYMPYVTEAIWQRAPHVGPSLMIAGWPQPEGSTLAVDQTALAQFRSMQALVGRIRNARAEYKVEPQKKIADVLVAADGAFGEALKKEVAVLESLIKAENLRIGTSTETQAAMAAEGQGKLQPVHLIVQDGLEAFLPMAGLVDMVKEKARLTKQLKQLEKDVEGLTKRLSAPGFKDKAPPAVFAEAEATLADKTLQIATIQKSVADIEAQ